MNKDEAKQLAFNEAIGLASDAMQEMGEDIMRLMALHLEVMGYLTKLAKDQDARSKSITKTISDDT